MGIKEANFLSPYKGGVLLYALIAEKEAGFALAWPVTTLVVCFSEPIHGATTLYVSPVYHWKTGKQEESGE